MDNDAPHTEGGESGTAHSGLSSKNYDKWYGVGKSMEAAKDKGKSY